MDRRSTAQSKPTEQVATRVTPETYQWLQEAASRDHRSVAAQVRYLIEQHVGPQGEAA